jgi:pimeloyl-ACP methyl ester carboxylesterase
MRKYVKWIFTGLFTLLVIAAVYPFVVGDMETLALDDVARASMPDKSFVRLSDGYTHYEWAGPENGQPVVLVCGALTPMFIWDYEFKALADAGFHVLRYDHFGRGLSDRPDYRSDLYDRQLLELLNSQNIKTPVDLVGRSMGRSLNNPVRRSLSRKSSEICSPGASRIQVSYPLEYKDRSLAVCG